MPTIWEDKYLQDHTKKELNALRDSYDNAEWVCPKCEGLSPVWNGMTVIGGWNSFGTEYRVNLYCYDCDFKRKNRSEYALKPGQKPRPKKRQVARQKHQAARRPVKSKA